MLLIKEVRMRIWRMASYVKHLKKVNYGIVVGLKVAQSELRRLRKAGCDVQRKKCKGRSQQRSSRTICG